MHRSLDWRSIESANISVWRRHPHAAHIHFLLCVASFITCSFIDVMSSSTPSSSSHLNDIISTIGKGSYGAAILVELKANNNQKFVVKEIVIGHLKKEEQVLPSIPYYMSTFVWHSNIIFLYFAYNCTGCCKERGWSPSSDVTFQYNHVCRKFRWG